MKEKQPDQEAPEPTRPVPPSTINEDEGTGHYISREAQTPAEEEQQREAEQSVEQDEENPLTDTDEYH